MANQNCHYHELVARESKSFENIGVTKWPPSYRSFCTHYFNTLVLNNLNRPKLDFTLEGGGEKKKKKKQ
jgi:hypothetical protein